jgi:hypothetical protein
MAIQLMGESQVEGSIIGLFLDLTREAFRNACQHQLEPENNGEGSCFV